MLKETTGAFDWAQTHDWMITSQAHSAALPFVHYGGTGTQLFSKHLHVVMCIFVQWFLGQDQIKKNLRVKWYPGTYGAATKSTTIILKCHQTKSSQIFARDQS